MTIQEQVLKLHRIGELEKTLNPIQNLKFRKSVKYSPGIMNGDMVEIIPEGRSVIVFNEAYGPQSIGLYGHCTSSRYLNFCAHVVFKNYSWKAGVTSLV